MGKIRLAAVATVLCLAALLAPAAGARTILVGGELTGPANNTASFVGSSATIANALLPGPNPTAAPVDGRVVRWRLGPQPGTDTYRLTVVHPTGLGTYTATATSDPQTASSVFTQAFATALPIEAGDLIGLSISSAESPVKFRVAQVEGAANLAWDPLLAVGAPAAAPGGGFTGYESQFNADLAPAPAVRRITPALGPLAGGAAVVISGRDFTEVGGVTFGSVPASSFTLLSENEILATAPAGARPGPVDVRVTNAIGTSPTGPESVFTYEPAPPVPTPPPAVAPAEPTPRCQVPRLTGRTLPESRRLLRRSRCRLGAVRGRRRNGDRVIRQSPRPGLDRPSGWTVNVTID